MKHHAKGGGTKSGGHQFLLEHSTSAGCGLYLNAHIMACDDQAVDRSAFYPTMKVTIYPSRWNGRFGWPG